MKHTEWSIVTDGVGNSDIFDGKNIIATIHGTRHEQREHARFIVKACNMHDELVGALREAAETIEYYTSNVDDYKLTDAIDTLLKRAKGE